MRLVTLFPLLLPIASGRNNRRQRNHLYGSSFIADPHGKIVAQANRSDECIIYAEFDLDAVSHQRVEWSVFRDRRPELYKAILTLDGDIC